MSKIQERYSQFKTSLSSEETLIAQGVAKDSHIVISEDPTTRQKVASRVTGAESTSSNASEYVIAEVGMPFSDDPSRPYQDVDASLSVLAGSKLLDGNFRTVPIVRVGTPGINHLNGLGDPCELTIDQKRELKSGMFTGIGQVCARALASVLEQTHLLDKKVIVLQRSMSVSIGIAAVSQLLESGVALQGIGLSEGVTYEPQNKAILAARFIATGTDAVKYLEQNPELCRTNDESPFRWVARTASDGRTNLRYGNSLAKGGFILDVDKTGAIEALRDSHTPVAFVNGSGSRLSSSEDNDRMASMFDRAGVSTERHEWPHEAGHGFTMTLGDNIKSLDILTK